MALITHKIDWKECLSHQIWPAIEQGWQDNGKPVHFFWGLAGRNQQGIRDCMEKGEEWWYVDTGYLTEQITRYPLPKINNYDKTYFRIVKGNLHTIRGRVNTPQRLEYLRQQGINAEFKGWNTGETKHIIIAPSSPTVTYHINGITQEQWIEEVKTELRKYTQRKIIVRNKPRPGNQWWGTDIKDQLKNCHALVTNLSLSAFDAIMNQVPVFCHKQNICSFVSSRDLKHIERPFRPGRKTIEEWLKMVADNQFTIEEMRNGTAYKTLMEQNV